MRVLLSYESLERPGGTETYTLTVAEELARLGHDSAIYAPQQGEVAGYARRLGLPVLSRRELEARAFELVISSDAATLHEASQHAPSALRLFVAHSVDFLLQMPPSAPGVAHGVVVLNDRVRRAAEGRAGTIPVARLRQPVDLLRYAAQSDAAASPPEALLFSNYFAAPRVRILERACRAHGWTLRRVGGEQATLMPELAIAGARVVIGLGRSVLEGMAAGRAAFVFGDVGGDGWVSAATYPAMEADGFAGLAFRDEVLDERRLTEALGGWEEGLGEVGRDLASAHHSAREHALGLLELAERLEGAPPSPADSLQDELARLVRLAHGGDTRAWGYLAELERLGHRVAELERRLAVSEPMAEEARSLRAQLEELKATRRYRLAVAMAAPLDLLRRRARFARLRR